MKKVLAFVVVAGLAASSADAAQLWMQIAGGGTSATIDRTLGETVEVDVFFQFGNAGDSLSTVIFVNQPAPGLEMESSNVGPSLVGRWQDTSTPGTVGDAGDATQVVWSNLLGPGNILTAAADGMAPIQIGSMTIGGTVDGVYDLAFELSSPPAQILNAAGTGYTILETGNAYNGYANYYNVGAGSPGYTTPFGTDAREALSITVIPEPASLALLALGGIAVLRRRS